MKFSAVAAAAALASVSQAVEVQVVSVGRNPVNNKTGLKYWPEKITAKPGTMVQFQFLDGNHTVTQSNFDNACEPLNKVDPSKPGIFSSFMPVAASKEKGEVPVFTVMINDTKPLWFYCSQGPHCSKGMAMVINENTKANSSRSLENYKTLAAGSKPADGGYGAPPAGGNDTSTPPPPADGGDSSSPPPDTSAAPPPPASGGETPTDAPPAAGTPTPSNPTAAAHAVAVSSTLLLTLGGAFFMML